MSCARQDHGGSGGCVDCAREMLFASQANVADLIGKLEKSNLQNNQMRDALERIIRFRGGTPAEKDSEELACVVSIAKEAITERSTECR